MLRGGCARLGVRDLDAAIRFYVDVLGMTLAIRLADEWAALDAGGGLVIGLAPREADEAPGGTVTLWTSEPIDRAVATLTQRGIDMGPVVAKDLVQMASFCDPDGNRLLLTDAPPSPTSIMRGEDTDERPLFEHLGLRWTDVRADGMTVELDIRDDLRGPAGTLQGGVIATLIDAAAASTAAQTGTSGMVATSEMTIHFLAPGRTGPVRAVGELLHQRAGGAAVEVRVYDAGQSDRLLAVALVAFDNLKGTPSDGRATG